MADGSLFSSDPAAPLMKSNARIGMKRDVYKAAENGSVDVLKWHNNWKHEKTAGGNNVLHVHVVTENVSVSFIQYVVNETSGNSTLLESNDNGDTPFHLAARFGHIGAVQEFLTQSELVNAALLNKANNNKDTALHDATREGHAGIVMFLVEAGGENALHHTPNNFGETPLFLAAERGCFESFNAIVGQTGRTALEHKGPCGHTALHLAVLRGNKDLVNRILEIDTSSLLIRVKNDQGQTPLHLCAAQNVKKQRTILRALLDQDDEYNSAAYIQDNEGRTPLHIATLNFNFNGAKMLICSYPDCIEMVDNKGQNVVHFAANSGCLNTLKLFLRKAPKCDRLINEKDNDRNTPLHLLVANKPTLLIHGFFSRLPLFLKRHKNLNVRAFNDKNLTAGDIIASKHSPYQPVAPRRAIKILPKGKRILNGVNRAEDAERAKTVDNVENKKNCRQKIEDRINHLRKVGETRLIVAALIATVSFTAGFTLPGGFNQIPGRTIGLAVLMKKASFIAFLIADTLAFTMSSLAVICYFTLANQYKLVGVELLSFQGYLLNSFSMGALMVAFVTGVYAVVSQFLGLAFTIIAISLFYFYFYVHLLVGCFRTLRSYITWNFFSGFLCQVYFSNCPTLVRKRGFVVFIYDHTPYHITSGSWEAFVEALRGSSRTENVVFKSVTSNVEVKVNSFQS